MTTYHHGFENYNAHKDDLYFERHRLRISQNEEKHAGIITADESSLYGYARLVKRAQYELDGYNRELALDMICELTDDEWRDVRKEVQDDINIWFWEQSSRRVARCGWLTELETLRAFS